MNKYPVCHEKVRREISLIGEKLKYFAHKLMFLDGNKRSLDRKEIFR